MTVDDYPTLLKEEDTYNEECSNCGNDVFLKEDSFQCKDCKKFFCWECGPEYPKMTKGRCQDCFDEYEQKMLG